jgi:carbamoyl-phosphate synthase large subunit
VARAGSLCLETGANFEGLLFGAPVVSGGAWGDVVFNTCMTGYQEIAGDPSYAGQVVVMTYPMIGNYGCRDAFMESGRFHCRALVVRDLSSTGDHAQAQRTLDEEMHIHGVPGLTGVDTRALTRHIRSHGSVRGILMPTGDMSQTARVELCRRLPRLEDQDLVSQVTQQEATVHWSETLPAELRGSDTSHGRNGRLRIVCLDLGIKRNQLRALAARGAEVITLRHDSALECVLSARPDGVVISNGPGDPATLPDQVGLVRRLLEQRIPLLGICLGHQILGQAAGGSTSRLPFGHHGGNHPVQDQRTGAVHVTAQNHEFQVDATSIDPATGWYVSERNLNDGSVEGLRHRSLPAFGVQYHPEGAPGPQDRAGVFDDFLEMCREYVSERGKPGAVRRLNAVLRGNESETPRILAGQDEAGIAHASSPEVEPVTRWVGDPRVTTAGRPQCVLVIGSGPVVIGQAAEFDYAGTQACRALREEGVRVVLVNSNPATIMTDDASAYAVYIEPLTVPVLERIMAQEKPDGILPTLGGQTALNLAVELEQAAVLDRHNVRVLGTSLHAIHVAEDREQFKRLLAEIGEPAPESRTVESLSEAREFLRTAGLPLVVRPAFTLGGTGGGLCETEDRFLHVVASGLAASPISQVLVERSLAGWREIEYEVMRDGAGTSITICNMENIDPMGVHTGDSIVVAPSQTLTDREHQQLRSAALRIIGALRIEGGCNVQFALAPGDHEYFVIEVNPRVSRSSALASKATGYPIARVAAKVALGMRLDEIANSITAKTTAAFEPALDYCVVKIPRWPFDKFPGADRRLGTQMKSTGEAMAIERTFEAALLKALRSLEQRPPSEEDLRDPVLVRVANDRRIHAVMEAIRSGESLEQISLESGIAVFFLRRIARIVEMEDALRNDRRLDGLREAKRLGFSDETIADLTGAGLDHVRSSRRRRGIQPTFKAVDTCAAEFSALTPYYYSCFESESEAPESTDSSVVVVGSGPIRIGQGIEFDYCSVQAAQSLKADGMAAVMINSNPETVSTDFDCSTRLYFEPLDLEAVSAVIEAERAHGALVQFGGQTAINLAQPLADRGMRIMGTPVQSIEQAEDRERFHALLDELGIDQPAGGATTDPDEAAEIAGRVGLPVLVRPSFVLGGRGMEIVHGREQLRTYMARAVAALPHGDEGVRGTVLIDKYLAGTEIDVDAIGDGETVVIPGLMEHVERAGVHSGDSMAVYPPAGLEPEAARLIVDKTMRIIRRLAVRGLCNIQFVIHGGRLHVIEVNPRASRTVPFISKVTGVPLVHLATMAARGERLADLGWRSGLVEARSLVAVKAPVFSTFKLDRVDSALGPEMKSTGEVMGIDVDRAAAVEKAFLASLGRVPLRGAALCSIADRDKDEAIEILRKLRDLGFAIYATAGTATALTATGITVVGVSKIGHSRPDVIDVIEDGSVCLVVNTVSEYDGDRAEAVGNGLEAAGRTIRDGYRIREAAELRRIPCCTSLDTARALTDAIERHAMGEMFHVAPVAWYRSGSETAAAHPRSAGPDASVDAAKRGRSPEERPRQARHLERPQGPPLR